MTERLQNLLGIFRIDTDNASAMAGVARILMAGAIVAVVELLLGADALGLIDEVIPRGCANEVAEADTDGPRESRKTELVANHLRIFIIPVMIADGPTTDVHGAAMTTPRILILIV